MFLPRIIPVLLLKGTGLVKTIKFKDPRYIGDPINAVRIFNDLKADELVFLDITASNEGRTISVDLAKDIGDEAFMPFGVGGGIHKAGQIELLLKAGAEKIVINTQAVFNPKLIEEAAKIFGSQCIIVSIDVKKTLLNKYTVFTHSNTKKSSIGLFEHIKNVEALGAGEILINSIDNDGMMKGYDINLIRRVAEIVNIPVIACGGAGSLDDMKKAYFDGKAHALAAGSMFVYHGPRRAVLINYPSKSEVKQLFNKGM